MVIVQSRYSSLFIILHNLGNNSLGDSGVKAIADALRVNGMLHTLEYNAFKLVGSYKRIPWNLKALVGGGRERRAMWLC